MTSDIASVVDRQQNKLTNWIGYCGQCALIVAAAFLLPSSLSAQEADEVETAKAADTVSPYGVSYHSGSFTYSLPLFSIGHGEWPDQVTVQLNYDSSAARRPNNPWTLSISRRLGGITDSVIGFEGDVIEELNRHGLDVVLANRTQKFDLGGPTLDSSNFRSLSFDGNTVDFVNGVPGYHGGLYYDQHGQFTVTANDGTTIEFSGGLKEWSGPFSISSPPTVTLPDGKKIEYTAPSHQGDLSTYISSSGGLIVRRYGSEVCAFNTAYIDISTITDCSQSPLVATINETQLGAFKQVTSVTRPDGGTYAFEYQSYTTSHSAPGGSGPFSSVTRYHLKCVKEPGQSGCAVSNSYDPCDGPGFATNQGQWYFKDSEWSGSRDRVIRQDLPDGRIVTYTYPSPADPCRRVSSVTMNESGATTEVALAAGVSTFDLPGPVAVTDPLQRTVDYTWTGDAIGGGLYHDRLASVVSPEGNEALFSYDNRGNRLETRIKAKTTGVADIVTSSVYPATCTNRKTCNKPTSVTDANGNTSTFTYSAAHGGVLTAVGPAVNGVSPATKYYYVQRTPWLKSGSGYAAGDQIWLLSEERLCRTSALNLSTGTCAAGSNDLVKTSYEYGPDSGPNNLWIRGVAFTADGQTLRTCYSYDALGRRISETQPKANLASCP